MTASAKEQMAAITQLREKIAKQSLKIKELEQKAKDRASNTLLTGEHDHQTFELPHQSQSLLTPRRDQSKPEPVEWQQKVYENQSQ